MYFFEILNLLAIKYYINNILSFITLYPIIYKGSIILPLTKNKIMRVYPWMLFLIYLYRRYLPYVIKISIRNTFLISFVNYIYNIRNNYIVYDNPFLEI